VSAIFAASVAYMTSLLTIAAGIFVRNFYIRVIRKNATEARQIFVGRVHPNLRSSMDRYRDVFQDLQIIAAF